MIAYKQLIELANEIGCEYSIAESMRKHTTFKIGGPCDIMFFPDTKQMAVEIIKACSDMSLHYIVLGNGSDMVFGSSGYSGAVISMSRLNSMYVDGNRIYCDAGVSMSALCNLALENSLTGAERLFGIPGTVGGAVCMNAGAYGGQIGDILVSCDYFDGDELANRLSGELELSYRHSIFSVGNKVVLSACFELEKGDKEQIRAAMDDYINRRRSKQPVEYPSAGSVFLRPEGHFAGALVEQCGFKGYSIGGAQVSEKHAGFIINKGDATSGDVKALVNEIKSKVYHETGVALQCEIKFVGED